AVSGIMLGFMIYFRDEQPFKFRDMKAVTVLWVVITFCMINGVMAGNMVSSNQFWNMSLQRKRINLQAAQIGNSLHALHRCIVIGRNWAHYSWPYIFVSRSDRHDVPLHDQGVAAVLYLHLAGGKDEQDLVRDAAKVPTPAIRHRAAHVFYWS